MVLSKATFSDLQALNTRINGHDEDLDILDKFSSIFDYDKQELLYRMTMTLSTHHLASKILTKAFTVYTKVLWK